MGNSIRKLNLCFTDAGEVSRRHHDIAIVFTAGTPLDEGLGHSFCYIRPDPCRLASSKVHCEEETAMIQKKTTTFRCISGASVSANTSTPLSTCLIDVYTYNSFDQASSFESSTSFASIPLQPVPRQSPNSIKTSLRNASSGPIERGFLSGPIERGFASGPIEKGLYSGPIEKVLKNYTHNEVSLEHKSKKRTLVNTVRKVIANAIFLNSKSIGGPIKGASSLKESDWAGGLEKSCENFVVSSNNLSSQASLNFDEYDGDESLESQNLQWAQGKAGEDRVHIVISEENGWVFIGIYDGFNGPDAPDFLISNLYSAVHKELKGLLWNDKSESEALSIDSEKEASLQNEEVIDQSQMRNGMANSCFEQDRREHSDEGSNGFVGIDHSDVLKALSRALMKTEEAYLDIADRMLVENPELALMGSCVLVMLMKGEDVYLMNVGDSRAVLAQKKTEPDACPKKKARQDLARINEETLRDFQSRDDGDEFCGLPYLTSLQLTLDHSTNVEEEVKRIMSEHLDDASAVVNDRVKGSLKVTRAFGAGFLKQPKWNNALLEMFRIDYVGTSPYITCLPSLRHHKLNPRDRFLILSSDGLYQYFTNEEAVSEVELFMDLSPEGDPAQHLIEELLFRAAKKAGMDFHELLDIPQGDRRRYHDDVSIIIISLEGRIWRSSV